MKKQEKQNKQTVTINKYIYDLDAIMKFIEDNDKRLCTTEIVESDSMKGDSMKPINKEVKETKAVSPERANIRYDLIRNFMTFLSEVPTEENDEETYDSSINDMLVFNTMCMYGFIKQVNIES